MEEVSKSQDGTPEVFAGFHTKEFFGLLDLSSVEAYKLCMKVTRCSWGHGQRRVDYIMYNKGLLHETLMRCIVTDAVVAIDEATKTSSGIDFGKFTAEQLTTLMREAIMSNSPEQVVALGRLKHMLPIAHEYAWDAVGHRTLSAKMFEILLKTLPSAANSNAGFAALVSNSPELVRIAFNNRCFCAGSPEEQKAYTLLNESIRPVASAKRRLPWPPSRSQMAFNKPMP
jgi:hypothetical protein